jgi:molybdate transport system substrate-binding protein
MTRLLSIPAGALLLTASMVTAAADLTVSAAASLTNAFTEIARSYEKANPGTRVLLNFGSSGSLLQQISRGAPVDVFASADLETMDRAQKQNLLVQDTRSNFVANKLVVVVPSDSSKRMQSLADLNAAELVRLGIGTPESVPAGRYAKQALEAAVLWDVLSSRYVFGQNVRQVLDYVARGEVDAGFVYATDAAVMKDRVTVVLEVKTSQPILYPIAAVKGGGHENAARRFIDFVKSEPGQQVLAKFGFSKP